MLSTSAGRMGNRFHGAVLASDAAGAGEADRSVGLLDKIPGAIDKFVVLIEEVHVDDEVSGVEFSGGLRLFATLDLGRPFPSA